jgi:hypothetical protein
MTGFNYRFGVFFEGQYARKTGRTDIVFEPEKDLALLKSQGITTINMQLYETYLGYLLYNSQKFPAFRESETRDYLQETLDAAKKLGMKVWLWSAEKGIPTVGPIYEEFHDALEIDQYGKPLATWDHNFLCLCINSKWKNFLIDVYQEVLHKYDGIECIIVSDEIGFNDAVRIGGYCPHCSELFKAKYGQEPPREVDWTQRDGLWWSFVKERFIWWRDYVSDLARAVKQVAPEVSTAVIMNAFALSTALKGVDPWSVTTIPEIDMIGSDLFYRVFEQDHPVYQAWVGSFMSALAESQKKRVFLTSAAYRTVPPQDIIVGTLDAAVHAGEGVFYYNLRHLCDRKSNLESTKYVSECLRQVKESLPEAVNEEGVAIVFPKDLWLSHYYENSSHLINELVGIFQTLSLAGVPAKLIFDDQLSSLEKYYMVFIPEWFSIPEEQARLLEEYVRKGGVLFISLQEPSGPQTQSEEKFWKLLGVEYGGRTPPIRSLHMDAPFMSAGKQQKSAISMPVYDWPVVQHQLFGGFPSVSHERARLKPSHSCETLLYGTDDQGNDYPLIVEGRLEAGTIILSSESFGASFNSYMQKCAGHPSIWMSRAMQLRDFLRGVVSAHCHDSLPANVETEGNVATFWWRAKAGLAAWIINHEYSDPQIVRLSFPNPPGRYSIEVFQGKRLRESRGNEKITIELKVAPCAMAAVVLKFL